MLGGLLTCCLLCRQSGIWMEEIGMVDVYLWNVPRMSNEDMCTMSNPTAPIALSMSAQWLLIVKQCLLPIAPARYSTCDSGMQLVQWPCNCVPIVVSGGTYLTGLCLLSSSDMKPLQEQQLWAHYVECNYAYALLRFAVTPQAPILPAASTVYLAMIHSCSRGLIVPFLNRALAYPGSCPVCHGPVTCSLVSNPGSCWVPCPVPVICCSHPSSRVL